MIRTRDTKISQRVARTVRGMRKDRHWTVVDLSEKLHDHRCYLHPEGYDMSPAVIGVLEHGVPSQHGYGPRKRSVTVDDLIALAHVFDIEPWELLP